MKTINQLSNTELSLFIAEREWPADQWENEKDVYVWGSLNGIAVSERGTFSCEELDDIHPLFSKYLDEYVQRRFNHYETPHDGLDYSLAKARNDAIQAAKTCRGMAEAVAYVLNGGKNEID